MTNTMQPLRDGQPPRAGDPVRVFNTAKIGTKYVDGTVEFWKDSFCLVRVPFHLLLVRNITWNRGAQRWESRQLF